VRACTPAQAIETDASNAIDIARQPSITYPL